ncbi:hypothetical protein [Azospirillum argentinense]
MSRVVAPTLPRLRVGPSLPRFAGEGKLAPSPAKRGRAGEGAMGP